MSEKKVYRAIGLMSGTSLDGIDCALIETDGHGYVKPLSFLSVPYEDELREQLRGCFGKTDRSDNAVVAAEKAMTLAHAEAVKQLGETADVIGFHGQTIYHAPDDGVTIQIGDGALLAAQTGMDVVCDMRSADVAAGGQGAPLAPLYHQALMKSQSLDLPVAVLNIGGVANVTWISEGDILAFDTGPGNAQLDDFVRRRTGQRYDENGRLARRGTPDETIIEEALSQPYFARDVPKSLDRDAWGSVVEAVQGLTDFDGAATLAQITVRSIAAAAAYFPELSRAWYVCGGGRHNDFFMEALQRQLGVSVHSADVLGWNSDATEAECFAYLAVRSLLGEPLSVPRTTGVSAPMTGGVLHRG